MDSHNSTLDTRGLVTLVLSVHLTIVIESYSKVNERPNPTLMLYLARDWCARTYRSGLGYDAHAVGSYSDSLKALIPQQPPI